MAQRLTLGHRVSVTRRSRQQLSDGVVPTVFPLPFQVELVGGTIEHHRRWPQRIVARKCRLCRSGTTTMK